MFACFEWKRINGLINRLLLISIAIIVDAVGAMKSSADYAVDMDQADGFALSPEDIKAGIVYILHYGRVLFKGEDETEPEPEPEVKKPGMILNEIKCFPCVLI